MHESVHGKLLGLLPEGRENPKTAFYYVADKVRAVSYGEFYGLVHRITGVLKSLGLHSGGRVAIVSENRHEWCAAYIAALSAGGITVPVDVHLTQAELKAILVDSDSKILFYGSENAEAVKATAHELGIKALDLGALPEARSAFVPVSAGYADTASLVYTSGTTGKPKAVELTHGNLCSDIDAVMSAGIVSPEDVVLSVLPLHHTYALMCTFLLPLSIGAAVAYPSALKGPELVRAMKEAGVSILIGVPRLLETLRNSLKDKLGKLHFPLNKLMLFALSISSALRKRFDLNMGRVVFSAVHKALGGRVKYMASGGARLEPDVMNDLEAMGFTVLEGYGLTETSPVVAFNPSGKRKPGSVGKTLKPAEIRIINPAENGEGEIAIRGPMVMKGYYGNPSATAEVLADGWFKSGDLGRLDSEGYLFITGRAKDVIILPSGKTIYPEDVERHYKVIPLIREICVIERGGRLHGVIVPDAEYMRKMKIGNAGEALKWEIHTLSRGLPPHMRLMGYSLHAEPLPKTPLGKFRRFMIKDIAIEKPAAPQSPDAELETHPIAGKVAKCIIPLLDEKRFLRMDDNLELDLGLDSLKRLELIVSLEQELGVKLPDTLSSEAQTIRELADRVGLATPAGQAGAVAERALDDFLMEEPSDDEKKRAGLLKLPFERPLRAIVRGFLKIMFFLLFRLRVKGAENLPSPPFIIVSNHASYLDGFAIAAGVPGRIFRPLYVQGYQRYFQGAFTSVFARLGHVILIDPETYLGSALRLSAHALKNGYVLALFPEGGRSFDGSIMGFKKGVGILAMGLDVPVVPAKITGSYQAWPRHRKLPRPGSISLSLGKPVDPKAIRMEGADKHQAFADLLKKAVEEIKL